MSKIILGVTGSVAAYRAADLARDLMRAGHDVRVCLTASGAKFVTPALFEALTGNPCLVDTFEEPVAGKMAHIDWARWADLILVAPASANFLNKAAQGIADDMLSTILLASDCPTIFAPAMNPSMLSDPRVLESLQVMKSRAAVLVDPMHGEVACGEEGQGKLASNSEILDAVTLVAGVQKVFEGKRVVITSGPTEEPIDDVRFISNRSSGKMGSALARAALMMGAEVTVVTGPTSTPLPARATVVKVKTALQMLEAAKSASKGADIIIGAAAVADYRPANKVEGKMRRSEDSIQVELVPNPDIIAALTQENPKAKVIAFAAEPSSDPDIAKAKMARKGVAAIVLNDVSRPGIGFEVDDNELHFITQTGFEAKSGLKSKLGCAVWLFEQLASHL